MASCLPSQQLSGLTAPSFHSFCLPSSSPILPCSSSQGIADTHLICESYLLDIVASFDPTELSFLFKVSSPFNVSAFLPPVLAPGQGFPQSLGVKSLSALPCISFLLRYGSKQCFLSPQFSYKLQCATGHLSWCLLFVAHHPLSSSL